MYFEEPRPERQPLRHALVIAAALVVNAILGALLLNGGIDNHVAGRQATSRLVADLGTLPTVEVRACRAAT